MAREARPTAHTRVATLLALVGLTVVLVLLGLVFSRSGPAIWFIVAFIGISMWSAFAILERAGRATS